MQLPDKVYEVLKWVALIALPAGATLYSSLAGVWGWPYATEVVQTVVAIDTFLGVVLGVSTLAYNAKRQELIQKSQNPYQDIP